MNFGAPNWFWALLAIPVAAALFVRAEHRAARRLNEFVSARLLPALAKTVDRRRRKLRFALILLGFALAVTALAKPRWGYIYEDVKRKGLDLICAVDTSRSMLSNDVPPSRLQRVKLAMQDLLDELQGDRVGLIAFAGRAFLQAPLTIDYSAAVEAINDLDTSTIPEGGTNISAAIELAVQTYGKSAIGNRALIVFTDGEELSGDAVKAAKAAADAGVRIFAVGVGTPEGSLIPLNGERGGTNFVKDSSGQVVKSKLDEKRLKEIAEATQGSYFHLEDGPRTMKQLFNEGLSKLQAGDIDERMSRRPIERYQWPLGGALLLFVASFLIRERRRERVRRVSSAIGVAARRTVTTGAALILLSALTGFAAAPGLDAYRNENYTEAYQQFEKTLQEHPNSHAADRIEFDAGAAAYKMGDYNKALEWFSRSLLSKDKSLQEKSHYNIGRTLEERADKAQTNEKAIGELQNAQSHYEEAVKLDSSDERAKANLEEVKRKIERLKQNPQKPSPPPQPPKKDKDKKDKDQQQQKDQKDQQQKDQQQKDQKQDQQQQENQSGKDQQQQKDKEKNSDKDKDKEEPKPGESPSPSPGDSPEENQPGSSPSPSADKGNGGDKKDEKEQPKNGEPDASPSASPSPDESPSASPSPSPGSGEGEQSGNSPSPSPDSSPGKKLSGEVKAAGDDKSKANPAQTEAAQVEPEKEGQMSEKQAQMLLQSMKDEEQRVQLDERKAARHVYKDW
jgi:Ca-activated chloride channel family protein